MSKIRIKRKMLLIFSVVLITVQVCLLGVVANSAQQLLQSGEQLMKNNDVYNEAVFKEVVLHQMTRQLQQVRETWFTVNAENTVPIIQGRTMDRDNLDKFLNIAVRSLRAFGPTGCAFVFDSESGEYYANYTLEPGGTLLNINDSHSDPSCKNPEGVERLNQDLKWQADVIGTNFLVGLRNEPNIVYEEAYNFAKYPLGSYNREFLQKIMLPLPNIGDRQVVVVLTAQEQDIVRAIKPVLTQQNSIIKKVDQSATTLTILSVVCIFISLILITVTNYALIIALYSCWSCSS